MSFKAFLLLDTVGLLACTGSVALVWYWLLKGYLGGGQ